MNKYIKPTFMFASLEASPFMGTNCSIQKDDRNMILGFLEEYGYDISKVFMEAEGCEGEHALDGIVEGYCKFSAGSNGLTQIFNS